MKQFILALFLLSLANISIAQITIDAVDYFPAPGDTLRTSVDLQPEDITITDPGADQTWDFSSLEEDFDLVSIIGDPDTGTVADLYPSADLLVTQIGGIGEGYYTSTANAYSVIAYAGADPLGFGLDVTAPFDPPFVERWAPLEFFNVRSTNSSLQISIDADQLPSAILDSLPVSPDSLRVSINTSRTDVVDAWGSLSIPGGTYDVLREKRTEYRDLTLEAKVGFFPWIDVTDVVVGLLMLDELGVDTSITYSYWSDMEKEPIAVVTMNNSETAVQQVEYKQIEIISNTFTPGLDQITAKVYPNPAIVEARFQFQQLPAGSYQLEMYNLMGERIWSKGITASGSHEERVDITGFPKGVYLYTLKDATGLPLLTQRLLVTKP